MGFAVMEGRMLVRGVSSLTESSPEVETQPLPFDETVEGGPRDEVNVQDEPNPLDVSESQDALQVHCSSTLLETPSVETPPLLDAESSEVKKIDQVSTSSMDGLESTCPNGDTLPSCNKATPSAEETPSLPMDTGSPSLPAPVVGDFVYDDNMNVSLEGALANVEGDGMANSFPHHGVAGLPSQGGFFWDSSDQPLFGDGSNRRWSQPSKSVPLNRGSYRYHPYSHIAAPGQRRHPPLASPWHLMPDSSQSHYLNDQGLSAFDIGSAPSFGNGSLLPTQAHIPGTMVLPYGEGAYTPGFDWYTARQMQAVQTPEAGMYFYGPPDPRAFTF
ncbi:hypothetical protein BKA70DRAFT_1432712 [Coprinopsis sp. MPI-PUGE-AT-0042]|nr:hypothetical protein BKA70DRAFT_1432712 [Coprinopsis sp. MPI-PUGE-AT-0042]